MVGDTYDMTNSLLSMIRDRNKNSSMMFYIPSCERDIASKIKNLNLDHIKDLKYLKQYRSKYIDKYFFLDKSNLKIQDDKNLNYSELMLYNKEIRIMLTELIKELA